MGYLLNGMYYPDVNEGAGTGQIYYQVNWWPYYVGYPYLPPEVANDIKAIRESLEEIKKALKTEGETVDKEKLLESIREVLKKVEEL